MKYNINNCIYVFIVWITQKKFCFTHHKTNAPEHYKDTCLKLIGGHWKKCKSRVKHDFLTPNKDDSKKLLTPPSDSRVNPQQWPDLVNYWQREDVQVSTISFEK